jgi:hypothetical protein
MVFGCYNQFQKLGTGGGITHSSPVSVGKPLQLANNFGSCCNVADPCATHGIRYILWRSGPKNNDRAATLGQYTEGDGHPGDHDDFHGTVHYAKHYAVLYTNMVD